MKFINSLKKIFFNTVTENGRSKTKTKNNNFFHNSFNKLLSRHDVAFSAENVEALEEFKGIMSEKEFIELLPANSYFH